MATGILTISLYEKKEKDPKKGIENPRKTHCAHWIWCDLQIEHNLKAYVKLRYLPHLGPS